MKDQENIYRAARMKACAREPMFSSRERTSSQLYVSASALYDSETGGSVPPCDVVQRMVEEYGASDLKRQHIRAVCPLMADYGGDREAELTRIALSWVVEFASIHDTALRFAALARDGSIDDSEIHTARTIRRKAAELRRVMDDTIAILDEALSGEDAI